MNHIYNNIPRLLIAGTHSGAGKTTISTALMGALTSAGYNVQPYKVGPDYIDPSYHNIATGNKSRNLDAWMLDEEKILDLFVSSSQKADISVIEGVMGLFDGVSGSEDKGSSAHIAKILNCPVVLILDVRSMARSAAAVVAGFKNFDKEINVAGVILNRIGSDRHFKMITEAIESSCDVPVLGFIRKKEGFELPSRHLGLIPTVEGGALVSKVQALAEEIQEGLDIHRLVKLAKNAEPIRYSKSYQVTAGSKPKVRIGIAYDEAFSFYYQDGLDLLEREGANLIKFSPIHDSQLPKDIDGIYIGGGFPEIFIKDLSRNTSIMTEIKEAGKAGMPIFAECGGYMYLSKTIVDVNKNRYPMAGLVPGTCFMEKSLVGMGYVEAETLTDNILAQAGSKLKGHEFHYSRLEPDETGFDYAFYLNRNKYRNNVLDGYVHKNILASYLHIHFASNPEMVKRFIDSCRKFKISKGDDIYEGH